ncbi:MAG: hypothetical protein R2788_08795 [Saprospiraceae bacterium]
MVSQSPDPTTLLDGHNDVETVTLTADDRDGNTADCSFTVTLKSVTDPVITCPGKPDRQCGCFLCGHGRGVECRFFF